MVKKYTYKSLSDTLLNLKLQIKDSLKFTDELVIGISDPYQLFEYLKSITTYKKDPPGVELLQTAQTLLTNNFHNSEGYGDCDCFTILVASCLLSMDINKIYITIAGNNKISPTHIYVTVFYEGHYLIMDLTEPLINLERKYRYKQNLRLKI